MSTSRYDAMQYPRVHHPSLGRRKNRFIYYLATDYQLVTKQESQNNERNAENFVQIGKGRVLHRTCARVCFEVPCWGRHKMRLSVFIIILDTVIFMHECVHIPALATVRPYSDICKL